MPRHTFADEVVANAEDRAWEDLLRSAGALARSLWEDAACEYGEPPKVFVAVVSGALRGAMKKGYDHAVAFGR
jgi:hypothetical protein